MDPWPAVAKGEPRSGAFAPLPQAKLGVPSFQTSLTVSNERLRPLSDKELQLPPLAPDVAVEILSPDDRRIDVDDKIDVCLRAGSTLVIVVDSSRRLVELRDAAGTTYLDEGASIEHAALPGFYYAVRDLFAVLRRA